MELPIKFDFKISTLSKDFTAIDANGKPLFYVKQKRFKLKEQINVYKGKNDNALKYVLEADQWLDFDASYLIKDKHNEKFGHIARKGVTSFLWRTRYEIFDKQDKLLYVVHDSNPWKRLGTRVLTRVPLAGRVIDTFISSNLMIEDADGTDLVHILKKKSSSGKLFLLQNITEDKPQKADDLMLLGAMVAILIEN